MDRTYFQSSTNLVIELMLLPFNVGDPFLLTNNRVMISYTDYIILDVYEDNIALTIDSIEKVSNLLFHRFSEFL